MGRICREVRFVWKRKGEEDGNVYEYGFVDFGTGSDSLFDAAVSAARRLGRGQGWCYRDLQRVLRRLAAVESSVTDMKEEQEQLRDRLEEAFDVVAAKLDMLTPEEEDMAAFSQGLENILGYTPEAGWEEA